MVSTVFHRRLFWFPLLIFAQSVNSQTQILKFEQLSIEEGLSQDQVYCIYQDRRGFLWLGTQDGLNRYDGYHFKIYRHKPENPHSLSDYAINVIAEDSSGALWIGTREGLNRFDRQTESFTHFRREPDNPHSLNNNQVWTIYIDRRGVLWAGTSKGLCRFNPDTQDFVVYSHDPSNTNSLGVGSVYGLIEDNEGDLWIAGRGGLDRLDRESGRFMHYRHDPSEVSSLTSNLIWQIDKDRNGNLWVGTYNGVTQVDLHERGNHQPGFLRYLYRPVSQSDDEFTRVRAVYTDRAGALWLGTVDGQLMKFDARKEKFLAYHILDEFTAEPGTVSIQAIFEDRSGVLWIATNGLGVLKHDKKMKPFEIYAHEKDNPNSLPGNEVTAICEDRSGTWWIGTAVGLSRFEQSTGQFRVFRHDPQDPHSLSHNLVQAIFEDSRGELWIGTWGGGLNRLEHTSGQFLRYQHHPEEPASLANDFVHAIYEDRHGNLWIGTGAGGLEKFDRDAGVFRHYMPDPERDDWLQSHEVNFIYEDHEGFLWLGATLFGIYRFDVRQGKFVNFQHDVDNPQSLSSNRAISIHESPSGALWIGTFGGGLNQFDRGQGVFIHYTDQEGLPDNSIYGILEDLEGNLWLSTNKGLSRFSIATKAFRNFHASDGLPSNQFNIGATCQGKNGDMFFGSVNGLLHFFPDRIRSNPFVPPVVLTDFQIFNRSVEIAPRADEARSKSPLAVSISEAAAAVLSHDQNVFTFEFAALHFAAPFKNQYAYKMEGFDQDWIFSGNRRFATYTNLDPGDYVFRVKGSNGDELWNEEGTSIRITVLPPWWKTKTAFATYVVLILAMLYVVRRFEMNRIQMRNQLRLRELETQKMLEVDHLKSRFFANISHEFRTPLTLILGPLEDVIAKVKDKSAKAELRVLERNATRLLRLINQLLDLSRLEAGRMTLRASRGDFVLFLNGIVMSFASLAEQKHISLMLEQGPQFEMQRLQEFYFDRDLIEKIFYNLLSNAFKFTPEGGEIRVRIDLGEGGRVQGNINDEEQVSASSSPTRVPMTLHLGAKDFVQITIEDTGLGIPADRLRYVFDRFYQVDDTHTREHEGTGIGLALTKELVERHHGSIAVRSAVGRGTAFIVRLPLGKEHLQPEEIIAEESGAQHFAVNDLMLEKRKSRSEDRPASGGQPAKSGPGAERHEQDIVLLVDDHPDMRRFIRQHLEPAYQIMEAKDGQAGVDTALEAIPDLVISDVMMPQLDGYQLCAALKTNEKTSHIPVILLTAKAGEESKLAGLETGADDYLVKPFNARELQLRAQNLIAQRRALRKRFRREGLLQPRAVAVPSVEEAFLQKLMSVMEIHLADEGFGVEKLSAALHLGRRQLQRKIRGLTEQSPVEFIRTVRLQRAKQLLEQHAGTVSEIAYQTGFNNLSHFAKTFHQEFGMLPSEMLKK